MPYLSDREIADLVIGTLDHFDEPNFQQIAQELQGYEVMARWLKKDRMVLDSGTGIKRRLMLEGSNVAAHVGLLDRDDVNIPDLLQEMDVPWRHARTHWGFIRQEILENRGRSLVTNIIKPRRANALIKLVEELESHAWDCPPDSTDKLYPYGIKYYIVKNANAGFNGGAPSGFTTVAGINPTQYPHFKNWTDKYASISKDDAILRMRKAARKTNFKSPLEAPDAGHRRSLASRYRIYMGETPIASLEREAEKQNDRLGNDLAPMDGRTTFKGNPLVYVPQLDEDTSDPIYGVDHASFYPVVLKGDDLRQSDPLQAPYNHNVWWVFIDLSYNYLCVDRRRNWVMYK